MIDPDLVPCLVPLCPAFAAPDSYYCVAHKDARKLATVERGAMCQVCLRKLSEGDYVTIDSSPGRMRHAECPPDAATLRKRKPRHDTPLFNDTPGAA